MNTERRAHRRNSIDTGIKYSYYGGEHQIIAKMQNHSPGGLRFISDLPIEPGSYISIMSGKRIPDHPWQEEQESICAEVAWCNQLSDNYSYGVGVKYYESLYDGSLV